METKANLGVEHLQEKLVKACLMLGGKGGTAYWRGRSPAACMLEILAPNGYHQVQQIADLFGMEFEEQFSNEFEWDRFRRQVSELKEKVERNLQTLFPLPKGISFCLGYDHEGNFGLCLRSEGRSFAGQEEGMN